MASPLNTAVVRRVLAAHARQRRTTIHPQRMTHRTRRTASKRVAIPPVRCARLRHQSAHQGLRAVSRWELSNCMVWFAAVSRWRARGVLGIRVQNMIANDLLEGTTKDLYSPFRE